MKSVCVIPHEDEGWSVRTAGGEKFDSLHRTRAGAIAAAIIIARKQGLQEVFIRDRNGKTSTKVVFHHV